MKLRYENVYRVDFRSLACRERFWHNVMTTSSSGEFLKPIVWGGGGDEYLLNLEYYIRQTILGAKSILQWHHSFRAIRGI